MTENLFYTLNWAELFSKLSAITYSYLRSCLSSLISFIDHIVFMHSPFHKIFSIIILFYEDQSFTSVNIFIHYIFKQSFWFKTNSIYFKNNRIDKSNMKNKKYDKRETQKNYSHTNNRKCNKLSVFGQKLICNSFWCWTYLHFLCTSKAPF